MSFEKLSDQQIWDIANPIMDNLMDASTHIDHARHVRDFTDRMKALVTPAYLQRICQQYQPKKAFFLAVSLSRFLDAPTQQPSYGNNRSRKRRGNSSRKWCSCIKTAGIWSIMRWFFKYPFEVGMR